MEHIRVSLVWEVRHDDKGFTTQLAEMPPSYSFAQITALQTNEKTYGET